MDNQGRIQREIERDRERGEGGERGERGDRESIIII